MTRGSHKRTFHGGEGTFSCEICGKVKSTARFMKCHMISHRVGILCNKCGKSFYHTFFVYNCSSYRFFNFRKKHIISKYGWDGQQNPFRIPYFTFLANLTTNKFEEKYGYIRAWVWRQFVPAGIVLTNVQGRQAILTKCHPDNMSS